MSEKISRLNAVTPAPPQCRRLVLRPGGLDQPFGARSAAGDRRNGHPCRPPPNRPRPGWPALFGLSSRLPAGAEVRRPSDLHRPSVHPQGRPKQPRQTEQRAETAKRSSGGQRTKQRPQRLTGERNQSQARQSRPASPRTALLLQSLPQATGPSGSPQWCRPQADPPAPARHRPVCEPT